tara:strand:- start:5281 stop:5952 length:672 start_codon:yes stop_codon:yes gene_type:complete
MNDFKEKRVWLVKMQNRLTATNAFMIDNSFIPKVKEILIENDGYIERKDIGRHRYLMIHSDAETLDCCIKELTFVSSYRDVTEQIVKGDYDKTVKLFDIEYFYRLYEADYLNKLMTDAMYNRGFILYSPNCKKLDLHLYFEPNPLKLEVEPSGLLTIKVRVKMYHHNKDIFIPYGYKAILTEKGLVERHSFSYEYTFVLKIIRGLLEESGICDYLKESKSIEC